MTTTKASSQTSATQTFRVYFRSPLQWTRRDFEAETAEQALALAIRFADQETHNLEFEPYELEMDCVNEIEVCDFEGDKTLAEWLDDDLRLQRAASDLLGALEKAVVALNVTPRFEVPSLATNSYAVAAICDKAIAKAKGGGS